MKTSPIITSILFSLAFLTGCSQAANGKPTIDGLFGIKLGEPLPSACTNSGFHALKPDEWGFLALNIVPPKTNSAFRCCLVTLTPTNRLVCCIFATSENSDSESFNGVLGVLRDHYGKEGGFVFNKEAGLSTYHWYDGGTHTLELSRFTGMTFDLLCRDILLDSHPPHAADKNGL